MKHNLFDERTEEKIRSKTTDQAIAKTFRLDRLDQIAEQKKNKAKKGVRLQIPRINRDGGFDYAPEVDPYEDMDVEGLLNLEDYVAPEAEKQIAKMPKEAPKYEMDPRFWQLPAEPPPLYEEKDPLAIEAPPEDEEKDEEEDEEEDKEEEREANKILDQLGLPNYDGVEMRLAEPQMTEAKQRNYLGKVVKDAERTRRQAVAMKSNATKSFKAGKITGEERDLAHNRSNLLQKEIKDYMKHYQSKLKSIKGSGRKQRGQRGRGAYVLMMQKECCKS